MGSQQGAPYRRTFNDAIERCVENGLYILWRKEMKRLTYRENPQGENSGEEDGSREASRCPTFGEFVYRLSNVEIKS